MTIDDAQLFSSLKLKSSNMLTELPKCDHQLLRKKAIAAGTLARDFTVAFAIQYPLDVVQTRLQVNEGQLFSQFPKYNNTAHAIFSVTCKEI